MNVAVDVGFFPRQDCVLICVMNGMPNLLVVYLTVRMGLTCVVFCVDAIFGCAVGARFFSVIRGWRISFFFSFLLFETSWS